MLLGVAKSTATKEYLRFFIVYSQNYRVQNTALLINKNVTLKIVTMIIRELHGEYECDEGSLFVMLFCNLHPNKPDRPLTIRFREGIIGSTLTTIISDIRIRLSSILKV